jgi:hypothetical protein
MTPQRSDRPIATPLDAAALVAGAWPQGSDARELYMRLLRAVVRRAVFGNVVELRALEPEFVDTTVTDRLWAEQLYWSHRSPLLIAHQLVEAHAAGEMGLPESFSDRLNALAAAGQRQTSQLMRECASVMDALGPPATALKGAWLVSGDIYPGKSRLFGDLDFALEQGTEPSAAVAALRDLGYEYRDMSKPDHLTFQRAVPEMCLYDGLPALREPLPNFGPHFKQMQRTFFVEVHYDLDAPGALRKPFFFAPEDESDAARHLLLLCHHLCKHEFAHTIGVVDVALMLGLPLMDWRSLGDLCGRFGAVDICAAAFGIVEHCFGPGLVPAEAQAFRSRRAFARGAALGWAPALDPRPTRQSRWLSVTINRSPRAAYRSAVKALSPHIPRNFPLRWAHRRLRTTMTRRRSARYSDD